MTNNVNMKIFNKLNSNSSYVLGWLMSDGCVYKNTVQLSIINTDLEILKQIAKILNYKNKITKHFSKSKGGTNTVRISFSSKYVVDKLFELGVIPRKSMKEIYPQKLLDLNDESLHRAFIRGYFEGDGHVRKNTSLVKILGSNKILTSMRNLVNKYLNIKCKIQVKHKDLFELLILNDDALYFLNWIYKYKKKNFLKRKFDIYKNRLIDVKKLRVKQKKRRNIVLKVVSFRENGMSWADIGKKLKFKRPIQESFKLYKYYKSGLYKEKLELKLLK